MDTKMVTFCFAIDVITRQFLEALLKELKEGEKRVRNEDANESVPAEFKQEFSTSNFYYERAMTLTCNWPNPSVSCI
jgi:hypothetical protein